MERYKPGQQNGRDSPQEAPKKPEARSRLTNGSALLPTVDGRSVWARLMRDTYAALIVHCGGSDLISEPRRMTARRAAALEAELVHLEDYFAQARAAGDEPDPAALDLYGRLADRQRRILETLGLSRVPRDVTPPRIDATDRAIELMRAGP